jgi:hypothetical protein
MATQVRSLNFEIHIFGSTLYTLSRVCPAMPLTTPTGKPSRSNTGPCSM